MKTIAVCTLKGGVGKTTAVFNLTGQLAFDGAKVLLVDMDPQCNLSNNVGIDIAQQDIYSTKDIFENPKIDPEKLVIKHPISQLQDLDIIPGHILLTGVEFQLSSRPARERILQYYIEDHQDFFNSYDYVVFDTSPSMGIINQNTCYAADSIILVSDVDQNSTLGAQLFMYLWEEIRIATRKADNVKALIINKFDVRTSLSGDLMDYFATDDELSQILIPHPIRSRVALRYAALQNIPVCLYKDGKSSTEEFKIIIQELKERGVL